MRNNLLVKLVLTIALFIFWKYFMMSFVANTMMIFGPLSSMFILLAVISRSPFQSISDLGPLSHSPSPILAWLIWIMDFVLMFFVASILVNIFSKEKFSKTILPIIYVIIIGGLVVYFLP